MTEAHDVLDFSERQARPAKWIPLFSADMLVNEPDLLKSIDQSTLKDSREGEAVNSRSSDVQSNKKTSSPFFSKRMERIEW